jgi:hypothetical protein
MSRTRWNLTEDRRTWIPQKAVGIWWGETVSQMDHRDEFLCSMPAGQTFKPPPCLKGQTLERAVVDATNVFIPEFSAQWEDNGAWWSDAAWDQLLRQTTAEAKDFFRRKVQSDCETGQNIRRFLALHGFRIEKAS